MKLNKTGMIIAGLFTLLMGAVISVGNKDQTLSYIGWIFICIGIAMEGDEE